MYDLRLIDSKELLIFDMDGTLFDTSDSNYWAYHDAAKILGYEVSYDIFKNVFVGKNYKEFLPVFGITADEEIKWIHEYKRDNYVKYLNRIRKNDKLFSIIESYVGKKKIALATTATRKNTLDILVHFGVIQYFDYVLAQEDVHKLKPDPECYICVMREMQVLPCNTIIFEDSEVGIMSAVSSGAMCIKVSSF